MAIKTEITLLKYRRTKIVATLGPSSYDEDTLASLIEAGVDVFRLNMSHGDHQSHRTAYDRVRAAASKRGRRLTASLADLSGPKIRVGEFPNGRITLERGQQVTVTTREVKGADGLIPSHYAALANDVKPGDRVLLDDGALELEVLRVDAVGVPLDELLNEFDIPQPAHGRL